MTSHHPLNPVPIIAPEHLNWQDFTTSKMTSPLTVPPRAFHMRLTIDETHLGIKIPHVSNLEFVRWLEVLAIAHAESLGFDDLWYQNHNLIWFVARHEINYLAELLLGDQIIMATWINNITKCRAQRRYVIVCENTKRLALLARTDWVLVSRDQHRPTRVTTEMCNRYLPLDNLDKP